ncbi:MAG: class I SAM-dependent methyltransferase [Aestuariivirga sp.]|nr:class I SAM-dependent methyltransferase [Aestuariivirga sp.]
MTTTNNQATKSRQLGDIDGCPVCQSIGPQPFLSAEGRDYWRCGVCEARFLDPRQLPSRAVEQQRYLQHRNDPDDPAYRRFLSKLADPLLARLPAGSRGLDYGCGPGPALTAMLREAGHGMALYDPFFHADPEPLERIYDFVTCTETVEHFHRPTQEFDRLAGLVRPGGWLAVMTCFLVEDGQFADWHYRKDSTHWFFITKKPCAISRQAGSGRVISRSRTLP